jgi:eukaryotic-like serine/threonine-protein kinase
VAGAGRIGRRSTSDAASSRALTLRPYNWHPPMALPPGTRFGRYEILSVIGAGGMGEVYRARDTSLRRDVAVKILPERFSADVARLARFQREAEVLASLNHPNIASIYALEGADRVQALVMEFVEGEDLAERIAHGAIPLDDVFAIAEQIVEALEAAHERGIIHRDLKPANIKVRPDGVVKLLDFGLAKALEADSGMASSDAESPTVTSAAKMTAVGMLLGTVAYMPPEQALGEELDARSDIFSLGVTIYEMATGTLPFKGRTWAAAINQILNKPPLSASSINFQLPPELDRLLGKALEKDRALRYQTVSDLAIDLKRIRRGVQTGAAENRSIVGLTRHRLEEHSTAPRTADAGIGRPILPTEAINPLSVALDSAPVSEILEMMANEDRRVLAAVHQEKVHIE